MKIVSTELTYRAAIAFKYLKQHKQMALRAFVLQISFNWTPSYLSSNQKQNGFIQSSAYDQFNFTYSQMLCKDYSSLSLTLFRHELKF